MMTRSSRVTGGSSPHARGARFQIHIMNAFLRDHPRMRGEHWHGQVRQGRQAGIIPACAGSTNGDCCNRPKCRGIIPACAGSTDVQDSLTRAVAGSSPHARGALGCLRISTGRARDHPRMRGEHAARHRRVRRRQGIIPACAGSTLTASAIAVSSMGSSPHARGARRRSCNGRGGKRDHPRMRGEHVRGRARVAPDAGIIPACAGSTSS